MIPIYTVHIAGEPARNVQRCIRCDAVLTGWSGHVAVAEGDGGPGFWQPGIYVGQCGGFSYAFDGRALSEDENLCKQSGGVN